MKEEVCSVAGCGGHVFSSGLCSKHYNRKRTTGTTDDGPKARLSIEDRFKKYVDVRGADDCWLWTAKSMISGYGVLSLGGARGKKILAHRYAWTRVNGQLPEIDAYHGAVVMHTCDNRLCCNPAHLVVGTQRDNVYDMDKKGRRINRQVSGEKHPNAKLTDDDIRAIRNDKRIHKLIAKDYGVTRANISYIKRGIAWTHVK
jgi:hypothetical protein